MVSSQSWSRPRESPSYCLPISRLWSTGRRSCRRQRHLSTAGRLPNGVAGFVKGLAARPATYCRGPASPPNWPGAAVHRGGEQRLEQLCPACRSGCSASGTPPRARIADAGTASSSRRRRWSSLSLSMGSCQRACRFAASCGVHHPYRVLIRPRLLAGPFAHIVVDETQELTDAEWQMLLLRCPSRSFTIVGDRVQARHGFTESWQERLERIGLDRINLASLNITNRTPEEVMAEAEPVIRAVLPDANVPTSIRNTDVPVVRG